MGWDMRRLQRVSFSLCGVLLAAQAVAQGPPAPSVVSTDLYVAAEPTKRTPPDYPQAALSKGREGWAKASFVISSEGKVIEAMIEESSHHDFDAPTLRAVESWHYKPAMLDGTPVEQSMVETVIRYQLEAESGASAQFIKKYRAI